MGQDPRFQIFDWFVSQHTEEGRAGFVKQIGPLLTPLFDPGEPVLDLGCGPGAVSLYLADRGAEVTGIDMAPDSIAVAREEAAKRDARVSFLHGNIITDPLGNEEYTLAVCLGNVVLDIPHQHFAQFRDRVHQALKPSGHFAVEYRDGILRLLTMREPEEVVEEGIDGPIRRRFTGYDPERGAYLSEYHHLVRGETYECAGYVYTGPLMRIVMESRFALKHSVRLSEQNFLDIYHK